MKIFEIVNKNLQSSINSHSPKQEGKNSNLPIITISREKGSGGIVIAKKLAKRLGKKWDYFDKDIVEKIAKESKTSIDMVNGIEGKHIPYFQDFLESLIGNSGLDLSKYHKNLIKVLCELGIRGNSIIVGRGANFIFKDALKVRIITDEDQRIKWLMQYEKMSEKAAKRDVEETDKESNEFITSLYNKDITDPKNYDLIIKTSPHLSVDDATDTIAKEAKRRFKL